MEHLLELASLLVTNLPRSIRNEDNYARTEPEIFRRHPFYVAKSGDTVSRRQLICLVTANEEFIYFTSKITTVSFSKAFSVECATETAF